MSTHTVEPSQQKLVIFPCAFKFVFCLCCFHLSSQTDNGFERINCFIIMRNERHYPVVLNLVFFFFFDSESLFFNLQVESSC